MEKMKQFEQYSDREIIHEILMGEPRYYEILIRRYNSFLYRIGRTYHYNHEDTEDIMQDTYVNIYAHLSSFENRSSFKTWITRIMLNNCYHKKLKFSYQKEVTDESFITEKADPMFHTHMNTENTIINKELGNVMEYALMQIAEDYRMVFTLRELNGLSVSETAEALNISESNVKVRLNRAKSMLRFEIEKMYTPQEIFEFNLIYCDAMVNRVMNEIGSL